MTTGRPTAPLLLGGVCGLAWAAGLRGMMAELTGTVANVDWELTFGWILAPGVIVGMLLGWTEHRRRGAWVAVYFYSFLAVLACACTIPHRRMPPAAQEAALKESRATHTNSRSVPGTDGRHAREATVRSLIPAPLLELRVRPAGAYGSFKRRCHVQRTPATSASSTPRSVGQLVALG